MVFSQAFAFPQGCGWLQRSFLSDFENITSLSRAFSAAVENSDVHAALAALLLAPPGRALADARVRSWMSPARAHV